jgi:ankyrin repeat protein
MKKRFQSVDKRDLGLIRSEAVVGGIVQYDYCYYSVLHAAAVVGWVDGVRYIIEHGILEVDVVGPDGLNQTPLFLASDRGHADVVRLLLAAGADPNIADDPFEETPLHLASRHGFLEVAAMLIDGGANLEVKDNDSGSTPLLLAASQHNLTVVKLLIDSGANVNAVDDVIGYSYQDYLAANERNPTFMNSLKEDQ